LNHPVSSDGEEAHQNDHKITTSNHQSTTKEPLIILSPTTNIVISTEAVHSLIVNRVVERPPHFFLEPSQIQQQANLEA
jgi:hypothetical protein